MTTVVFEGFSGEIKWNTKYGVYMEESCSRLPLVFRDMVLEGNTEAAIWAGHGYQSSIILDTCHLEQNDNAGVSGGSIVMGDGGGNMNLLTIDNTNLTTEASAGHIINIDKTRLLLSNSYELYLFGPQSIVTTANSVVSLRDNAGVSDATNLNAIYNAIAATTAKVSMIETCVDGTRLIKGYTVS
jgi:hypothetical protein